MRIHRVAALAAALLCLVAPAAAARPLGEVAPIDRGAPDCQQIPPEVTPPLALEKTPVLPLEVRVMVERDHLTTAREYMAVTRAAFERIGVRMKVRYDVVVPPAWPRAPFDEPSADELFEFMKSHYGGERPPGVDLVYFMTQYWSGGIADCIGGVRFPDRAFALGSFDYHLEGAVPSPANEGVIAAHELGHLLGAHHHYSNCAEAQPSGATRGDTGPCTTMSPLATTASSTFGTLEATYIRHYVEQYAKG